MHVCACMRVFTIQTFHPYLAYEYRKAVSHNHTCFKWATITKVLKVKAACVESLWFERAFCTSEQLTWETSGSELTLLAWPSGTLICICLQSEKQLCCVRILQPQSSKPGRLYTPATDPKKCCKPVPPVKVTSKDPSGNLTSLFPLITTVQLHCDYIVKI